MKRRFLPFLLITLAVAGGGYYYYASTHKQQYVPINERQELAQGIHGAVAYMSAMRNNQITHSIDIKDVLKARQQVNIIAKNGGKLDGLTWVEMGPDNIGGRTRALIFDNRDNTHNTLYAGGVAGGLWKSNNGGSSWVRVPSLNQNIAISAMTQASNGDIYVGTGEGLYHFSGQGTGGFIGGGVYKSTDGNNFSLLESTIPNPENSANSAWVEVNEMASCPVSGRIYASTNKGLMMTEDGGATWQNPVMHNGNAVNSVSTDVIVTATGRVIASVSNECWISPNGDVGSFVKKSGYAAGQLPLGTAIGRLELAYAPSNPQILYASTAKGSGYLHNIYRSEDGGDTWFVVGPGGSENFQPFRNQGTYNNTIMVFPDNENEIVLGGIDLWKYVYDFGWEQKTFWNANHFSNYYVHADQHKYVFHPSNPNIFYHGTDGGISRTYDRGETFQTVNKNYNITQFYSLAIGPKGDIAGGTQDNGSLYISLNGNTPMAASKMSGGDGGCAELSTINPHVLFTSVYNGVIYRFSDKTNENTVTVFHNPGSSGNQYPFVTTYRLWENHNDPFSKDTIIFKATKHYSSGEVLTITSKNNAPVTFNYTLEQDMEDGDSVIIIDPIQSKLVVGGTNFIKFTRTPLNFTTDIPTYYTINVAGAGLVTKIEFTKDGNAVYFGTDEGKVFRVSDLNNLFGVVQPSQVSDLVTIKEVYSASGRYVTSIALDPNNPDHMIVTLGNYGNNSYVYRCVNLTSENPVFTSVQGNLPAMPVYSSLIEMHNSNYVIIGTEEGVFSTNNIGATNVEWTMENTGMDRVPVLMIRQQTKNLPEIANFGSIYIATHGRGIFRSDRFVGIPENESPSASMNENSLVKIFPNPVTSTTNFEFNLKANSNVVIEVYNLSGQIVKSVNVMSCQAGMNTVLFDATTLSKGNYIVRMKAGKQNILGRFVVVK